MKNLVANVLAGILAVGFMVDIRWVQMTAVADNRPIASEPPKPPVMVAVGTIRRIQPIDHWTLLGHQRHMQATIKGDNGVVFSVLFDDTSGLVWAEQHARIQYRQLVWGGEQRFCALNGAQLIGLLKVEVLPQAACPPER